MGFRRNPRLKEELEPAVRATVMERAGKVQAAAADMAEGAHAPWMKRQGRLIVVRTLRDGARVVNTDHAGHLLEWGSRNNPPHAPLRRAVRAAGLHLKEH